MRTCQKKCKKCVINLMKNSFKWWEQCASLTGKKTNALSALEKSMLYWTSVNCNPALSPFQLFFFFELPKKRQVAASMLLLQAHIMSRFAKTVCIREHICKNNKVTKHELLNLRLLFTLVYFLGPRWAIRFYERRPASRSLSFIRLHLRRVFNSRGLFRLICTFHITSFSPFV